MRARSVRLPRHVGEKKDCERCGFTYLLSDLILQRGLYVCKDCYDEPSYRDDED